MKTHRPKKQKPSTHMLAIEYLTMMPDNTGHHIKVAEWPFRPVAIVPEPHGGKKVNGRSPGQTKFARLFAASPEMQKSLKRIKKLLRLAKIHHRQGRVSPTMNIVAELVQELPAISVTLHRASHGDGKRGGFRHEGSDDY